MGRYFFALGLKEITGEMFCPLTGKQLCELFPETRGIERLGVKHKVDYMIGLEHSSWQPQQVSQAARGGDLWVWENRWGRCIGGRHPWINCVPKKKTEAMCTVISTLFTHNVTGWYQISSCPDVQLWEEKGNTRLASNGKGSYNGFPLMEGSEDQWPDQWRIDWRNQM